MAEIFDNLNLDDLGGLLESYAEKAKGILTDSSKFDTIVMKVEEKAKNVPAIGEQLSDLTLIISMARDYITKAYTDIAEKTILFEIGALIYLISPIDLIPDKFKGIGHLDDIAVILFVQKLCHDDIEKYRAWKQAQ